MTPEENAEYHNLFGEFRRAINHAYEVMIKFGADSKEHEDAEHAAGRISAQMRKLRGDDHSAHWMGQ